MPIFIANSSAPNFTDQAAVDFARINLNSLKGMMFRTELVAREEQVGAAALGGPPRC